MRRFLPKTLAAALFVLPALVSGAHAEPATPLRLETLVPGTTLAFASLEDVGRWKERYASTALGRLAADPEMQAFSRPIEEDVQKLMHAPPGEDGKDGRGGRGGFDLPPIALEAFEQLQGLSGQAAVAVVGWPKEAPPSIAACLDFGGRISDFVKFMKRLEGELQKEEGGDKAPLKSQERNGRTWWVLGGEGEKVTVHATTLGTAILLSTDALWLEGVVGSEAQPLKGSLAESAAFARVKARAGGADAALFVFANVPEILERAPIEPDARNVANALGLDTIHGAGYGCAFKGDGFLDTLVIDAPKSDHGLLKLLETKAVTHRALAIAPSSAILYSESGVSVSSLLPKVRDVVERASPKDLGEFDEGIREVNEALGLDLQKDLLAGFADETALWLGLPPTGGLYPEVGVAVAVKDPEAFERTFASAVDGLAARLAKDGKVTAAPRVIEYHGRRLHVLDLSSARKDLVPFTPTWTMIDDRLVVTLVPHAMKEIVLRVEAKEAGLSGEEDVRALLRAAPENHGGFEYVDLQAVANFLYDTAVPALQTAAKPNLLPIPVRLDWAQLPAARTVRPYFRSLGFFLTSDDDGLRLSVHSPIPAVPLIGAAGAAAALFAVRREGMRRGTEIPAVAVPRAFVPRREDPKRNLAAMQTKWIADAVEAYHIENGSRPASLEVLTQPSKKTGEPFLERVPLDPWGQPYDYAVFPRMDSTGKMAYRIASPGPDRTLGTDDDVIFPPSDDGPKPPDDDGPSMDEPPSMDDK